jgi:hypothetical protein
MSMPNDLPLQCARRALSSALIGDVDLLGLRRKYIDSKPPLLEERDDPTVAGVNAFLGRDSNSMPPFRKAEICDAQFDALARSLN